MRNFYIVCFFKYSMGEELTKLVELAVACARQGRTLQRIGGYLTSKEQELIPEIYSRIIDGQVMDEDSFVIAIKTSKTGRKRKISMSDAVNWFVQYRPKWSQPLQKKMREELPPLMKTILAYGLKEGMDLPDDYYVNVIRDIANVSEERAERLYHEHLKPQMQEADELSGLIETEIKKKKE